MVEHDHGGDAGGGEAVKHVVIAGKFPLVEQCAGAGGPMAGLLQTQAQGFIETLKKSVRELRITVSWQDGRGTKSYVHESLRMAPNNE